MKRHVIYNKNNGNIDSVVAWGDDRDFPTDCPLGVNQSVKTVTDDSIVFDGIAYGYNEASDTFHLKLGVTSDAVQISHVDGVANITVTYPGGISEVCNLTLDGQTVGIDVINGSAVFPFTSQVLGWHHLNFSSTSHFGSYDINVEVV